MSSQFKGPWQDPNATNRKPTSELWGPWGPEPNEETTQPLPDASAPASPANEQRGSQSEDAPVYREHVTGALPAYPSEAPRFQPAYNPFPPAMQGYHPQGYAAPPMPGYPPQAMPPYPGYHGYPGYPPYPAYPGYPMYAWHPPQPKRDGYLFAMAIVSLIGAILTLLGGLGSGAFLALFAIIPHSNISESQFFGGVLAFVAFTLVGLIGGSFSLYHSIRSLMRKSTLPFALPMFWIFALAYVVILGIGFALRSYGQEVSSPAFTGFLILLSGIFPALAFLALGVRRLRYRNPQNGTSIWTTSWRRFTLALTSGATFGLGLALILELAAFAVIAPGQQGIYIQQCLNTNTPDAQSCLQPGVINAIILTFVVFGPLIEEIVKPLAVVIMIGRMRSAAEAFILGMACGVGFDLVETTLYISSGYHDWLNVALLRSAAGLLHGFGAAMVALGWYYLTHSTELPLWQRLLRTLGCWVYAALQHGIWNGTIFVTLLPAPLGPFLDNWKLDLGFTTLNSVVVIYIVEMILMTAFFIYITGRLKTRKPPSSTQEPVVQQPSPQQQTVPSPTT